MSADLNVSYQFCLFLFFSCSGETPYNKDKLLQGTSSLRPRLLPFALLAGISTSPNLTFRTRGGHRSVRNWCPARGSRGQIPERHQVQQRVRQQPATSQAGDWDLIPRLLLFEVCQWWKPGIKMSSSNDEVLCFYSELKRCHQGVTFCFCVPSYWGEQWKPHV